MPGEGAAGGGVAADAGRGVGLVLAQGFLLEEGVRQPVQPVPVVAQRFQGLLVAFLDDPAGFGVDQFLCGRGGAVQAVG